MKYVFAENWSYRVSCQAEFDVKRFSVLLMSYFDYWTLSKVNGEGRVLIKSVSYPLDTRLLVVYSCFPLYLTSSSRPFVANELKSECGLFSRKNDTIEVDLRRHFGWLSISLFRFLYSPSELSWRASNVYVNWVVPQLSAFWGSQLFFKQLNHFSSVFLTKMIGKYNISDGNLLPTSFNCLFPVN